MTTLVDALSVALLCFGAFFFLAGTVGILRLPDVYTRLHALTKADNLGLGLTIAGLMVQSETAAGAMKLLLIWLLVVSASSTISYLIANTARARGIPHWRKGS